MKLNGKFMQAAALAVLLPAAAMMAGCDNTEVGAQQRNDVRSKMLSNGDYFMRYSKEDVDTKNDLECIRRVYAFSCNWDKANGLVPADPAP